MGHHFPILAAFTNILSIDRDLIIIYDPWHETVDDIWAAYASLKNWTLFQQICWMNQQIQVYVQWMACVCNGSSLYGFNLERFCMFKQSLPGGWWLASGGVVLKDRSTLPYLPHMGHRFLIPAASFESLMQKRCQYQDYSGRDIHRFSSQTQP